MTAHLRLTVVAAVATLLASLALTPVLDGGDWFAPVLWLVAVTAAACAGARRVGVPRGMVPLAGLLGLVLAATVAFGAGTALLVVIPTLDTVLVANALLLEAGRDIRTYAAPVLPGTGLTFLAAGGLGLVALAVDTLAVTMRRPGLAGLPLLAVFVVPALLAPDGVGWVSFALGAVGFLALLLADSRERVSRWGRALTAGSTVRPADEVVGGPLASLGRRVGVAAVGAAVLVPAALPALHDGLLTTAGTGFGPGNGASTVRVVNPILNLRDDLNRDADNVTVLTYRTDDPDPSYVRMVTLDAFDGTTWEPRTLEVPKEQRVDAGLPRPPGLAAGVATDEVETDVQVAGFDTRWLPLPYAAQQVEISDRWLYDISTWNVFSSEASTAGTDYTVASLRVRPTPAQLRDAEPVTDGFGRYLELPDSFSPDIAALAEEITADQESAYDRALALQNWLRDTTRFTYDEEAPAGNGTSAIQAFLEERRGFCVHFASAMALMARTLDIPARVSVGFLPGIATGADSYAVRLHDAHSWPELYFNGVGWISFEPTPGVRTGEPPEWAQGDAGGVGPDEPTAAPTASAAPTTGAGASTNVDRQGLDEGEEFAAGGSGGVSLPWRAVGAVLVLLALALLPAAARALVRRRRWRRTVRGALPAAAAAWDEVADTALDLGYAVPESETPRQRGARLRGEASMDEAAAAALTRLARATEQLRYARSAGPVDGLRGDADTVAAALRRPVGRSRRWRARLLPASTVVTARAAGERLSEATAWAEGQASALRTRLRPRRAAS